MPDPQQPEQPEQPEQQEVRTLLFTFTGDDRPGVTTTVFEALGLDASHGGVVRVSMAHYNTLDEIDRLIVALDEAMAR